MSFPPSKVGDIYNYRVAAFLKAKGIPELGPNYDLTRASITADPPQIPSSATLFHAPVSFDAIASTANWEIFIECKHKLKPQPISPIGREWMEAVAEFLSLESFRDLHYKDIKYFFITNSDTTDLSETVRALRVSSDLELTEFAGKVKLAVLRKWKKSRVQDIPLHKVRTCLDDVRIFTFEDSKLDSLDNNPTYVKAYNEITKSIGERLPDLPRNLPSSVRILVLYGGLANSFVTRRWAGYSVSVTTKFIRWVNEKANTHVEKILEINFNELPSGEHLTVRNSSDFSMEQVTAALTTVVNEVISKSQTIFVVSSMNRKLYLVDSKWLLAAAIRFRDPQYRFHLATMQSELQLPLGGLLLQIAIQEAYKARKSLNLDASFFLN